MGDLSTPVSDIPTRTSYIDVRKLLCYFDGTIVMKEDEGPAFFRIGERGRRLNYFSNEADQGFLVGKERAKGFYVRSDATLLDASLISRGAVVGGHAGDALVAQAGAGATR